MALGDGDVPPPGGAGAGAVLLGAELTLLATTALPRATPQSGSGAVLDCEG
jgi:hypothetical protein